jgi:excisionase family DNA binding protein
MAYATPLTASELRSVLADMLEGAAERLRRSSQSGPNQPSDSATSRPTTANQLDERLTLSVAEAAARLGISRTAAYEAIRTGAVPSLRIGRRLLVPMHALRDRLDQLAQI